MFSRILAPIWRSSKSAAPLPAAVFTGPQTAKRPGRIILDTLRQEQASEVIKIKTMTSAEIQLNPFLESNGVRVHETDLAEIILQLGEEPPSHIVVPALHVNRRQVREIFVRKMGLPELSDDPQILTASARSYLREKRFSRLERIQVPSGPRPS